MKGPLILWRRRPGRQRIIKLVPYIETCPVFAKMPDGRNQWIVSIKLIGQNEQWVTCCFRGL